MNAFAWALIAFVLLHVGVSGAGLRPVLVRALGEGPYRLAFAIASAALLIWMIFAFAEMRANPTDPLNAVLWTPPAWGRHVAYLLILLGFVFVIGGVSSPGPTLVGFEGALKKNEPAHGFLRITRHPFLWGVAFWAAGHLAVNGERFALVLFGALGVMVLLGTRSIDRKGAARNTEAWARFATATSNVPFAAIIQGRNKLALSELWWRTLAGIAVFALVGLLHARMIGVPAFSFAL